GGGEQAEPGHGRVILFAAASEPRGRMLVDNARRKQSAKHGGGHRRVDLEEAVSLAVEPGPDILGLDEALTRLAQEDPVRAEGVKLRFFAGLTVEQTADALAISRDTASRHWAYAKVWLYCALTGEGDLPT